MRLIVAQVMQQSRRRQGRYTPYADSPHYALGAAHSTTDIMTVAGGMSHVGREQHDTDGNPKDDLLLPDTSWSSSFAYDFSHLPTITDWEAVTRSYPEAEPWRRARAECTCARDAARAALLRAAACTDTPR